MYSIYIYYNPDHLLFDFDSFKSHSFFYVYEFLKINNLKFEVYFNTYKIEKQFESKVCTLYKFKPNYRLSRNKDECCNSRGRDIDGG